MSDHHDGELPNQLRELREHADLGLEPGDEDAMVTRLRIRLAGDARMRAQQRRVSLRTRRAGMLAGVTGLLVAGGVASAATGLWNPPLGDNDRGHPTTANTDVPADQLKRFGVLRRPATDADRDAATLKALRYFDAGFRGVRTDRIRDPEGKAGDRYLIVPVERWTATGVHDAICLFMKDREAEAGGVGCWNTAQIATGEAITGVFPGGRIKKNAKSLSGGRNRGGKLVGLVPDGVTTVSTGAGRVEVHDNLFVAPISSSSPPQPNPVWFDVDGREVPQTQ